MASIFTTLFVFYLHLVQFIPSDLQVSDNIDLYPGYDGTLDQAINKFSGRNLVDGFLGFPYIPSVNPSVAGV